jgi:transposase InsO family protein
MHCFIWRWGTLSEIVTDNGVPWLKALEYLSRRYHINHIHISGYNSHTNGLVERSHFDLCQAIFKVCDGNQAKWHPIVYSVFWAECVTVHCRMGCSPYFTVTGTHPLLPLNIAEATYLLPPPDSILSTTNLITNHTIALQKRCKHLANLHNKVYEVRLKAAAHFKLDHTHTMKDYKFILGNLVLMRNTTIEKALNRKMRAHYLGPLIVILCNEGGTYILSELNGALLHRPVTAFRIIPYFACKHINILLLDQLLDVSMSCLRKLENTTKEDPEGLLDDDDDFDAAEDDA